MPVLCETVFLRHASATKPNKTNTTNRHNTPNLPPTRIFYFVHIPKTGGAALKRSLAAVADPLHSLLNPPQNLLLPGRPSRQKTKPFSRVRILSRGHLRARDIDPRIPTFAIVRDPYARIRSAFRFVMGGGDGSEVWGEGNQTIKDLKRVFDTHQIRTLSDIFRRPTQDPVRKRILAHEHFRPMVDAVEDAEGNRLVDKCFVLERFARAKPPTPKGKPVTSTGATTSKGTPNGIPNGTDEADAVANHLGIAPFEMLRKNESGYSYELSEEDRGWIGRVYERDVGLYREVVGECNT